MINANWIKTTNGYWPSLKTVNLSMVNQLGVYIIWYQGNPGRVIRVGQGDIAKRLDEHRNNPQITVYEKFGELLATWAILPSHYFDGIETYLAQNYLPLVGTRFPDVPPIPVNTPK